MKPARIEYMLFASLQAVWQYKQDAEHKALDGIFSCRRHESVLLKRSDIDSTVVKMLLIVWVFSILIAFSTARGDEDLELRLDGGASIELNITHDELTTEKRNTELILLFKTIQPSGIIFWATGTTGDMLMAELVRGKLR